MYKYNVFKCLIVLFFFVSHLDSSYSKYLDQTNIKSIFASNSRHIISLNGVWEKTNNEINWANVSVPYSDLSTEKITFVKKFKIEKEQFETFNWQLFFLGFHHQAEISINGQFLGRFISAMAPLWVKIPPKALNAGSNEIRITFLDQNDIVGTALDRYIYARKRYIGLVREAFLVGNPPIWVSDIKTNYTLSNNYQNANITANISISSANLDIISRFRSRDTAYLAPMQSRIQIVVESKLVKLTTGEIVAIGEPRQITIEAERTINVDLKFSLTAPVLWSPDNPNLYSMQTKILQAGRSIDDYSINFGLKSISISKGDQSRFILNGNNITLKSVAYVDYHIASGQSLSLWRMEEDVRMIKTLGANAIRFKFNPPHPYFSYLCDKYGLLQIIDLPIYNIPYELLNRDEFKVYSKNFSKMLAYYKQNYVSAFAFNFSDGLCEKYFPNDFAQEIAKIIKSDGNYFFSKFINPKENIVNTDNFDFIGINLIKEMPISSQYQQLSNILNNIGDKPFITCFGVPIDEHNHNGYSDPLSNEHQAYFLKNLYNLSLQKGAFGTIINSFSDYELKNPYLATNNYNINLLTVGITDAARKQRFAFNMLQALFNDEKEPLINAGSYSGQTLVSFIIIGFILLAVLLFFINRFRRFREYLMRALLRPYNFYSDVRDQRIIPSFQTLVLGLIASLTIGLFVSLLLYNYKYYDVTQYLIMLVFPSCFLQEIIYKMIWMPEVSLLLISIFSFILIFVISLIIKIFAFFTRARIYFSDCLIISVWAGAPFVFLLPLAIPLTRLLEINDTFALIAIIVFLVILIWVISRILKSAYVVFDKSPAIAYFIGLVILGLIIGIPIGFYQINHQFFAFASYLFCAFL